MREALSVKYIQLFRKQKNSLAENISIAVFPCGVYLFSLFLTMMAPHSTHHPTPTYLPVFCQFGPTTPPPLFTHQRAVAGCHNNVSPGRISTNCPALYLFTQQLVMETLTGGAAAVAILFISLTSFYLNFKWNVSLPEKRFQLPHPS